MLRLTWISIFFVNILDVCYRDVAACQEVCYIASTFSYAYDLVGNLTSTDDPSASYSFLYDALNRQVSGVADLAGLSDSITLVSQYDKVGNRTQLDAAIGSTADFRNSYQYDGLNRLTGLTQQANGGNSVAYKHVDLVYNDASQLTSIERLNASATVATSSFLYDLAGQLKQLDHTFDGGSTIIDQTWTYDLARRVTGFDSTEDTPATSYSYDRASRLTGMSGDQSQAWSYDAAGNRTHLGANAYTVGPGNRIASDGTYSYTYDNEGSTSSIQNEKGCVGPALV